MPRNALFVLAACIPICAQAQEPKPFVATEVTKATATVESVDREARTVVLRGGSGDRFVVTAGPEVRNFDRIEAGDRVVASYHEAIIAEVKQKGQGVQGVQETVGGARAQEGAEPGGAVVGTIATTVQIQSVDAAEGKVTFRRPDGIVRTATVENPEAKQFVSQLKPDDEVQITYNEALAVSLEPAEPAER